MHVHNADLIYILPIITAMSKNHVTCRKYRSLNSHWSWFCDFLAAL